VGGASVVAVGVAGGRVSVASSVAVGVAGEGVGLISVAAGVGGGDAVGGIGVAPSGRWQAESNANSSNSKPHNTTLAFIAVLLLQVELFYISLAYLASGAFGLRRAIAFTLVLHEFVILSDRRERRISFTHLEERDSSSLQPLRFLRSSE